MVIKKHRYFRGSIAKALASGSLSGHYSDALLATKIARIINDVCQTYQFGQTITGDCCTISRVTKRLSDPDPYRVSLEEDPFSFNQEVIEIKVSLLSNALISKFKHLKPEIEERLQSEGFTTITVKSILDNGKPIPQPFTQTTYIKPIAKNREAAKGAESLADKLPEGALREALLGLAKSLAPKKNES